MCWLPFGLLMCKLRPDQRVQHTHVYTYTCNHTHINIILSPSHIYIYMYSTPFLYDPVSLHSPHPRSYYRNHLSCPILYGVELTIRLEDHHYCPLTRHYHCLHPHLNPKHMCTFICFIMCFSWIGETLQQSHVIPRYLWRSCAALFCLAPKAQEQPLVAVALRVPPLQPLAEERYIATRPSLLEEGRGKGNGDAVTGGAVC